MALVDRVAPAPARSWSSAALSACGIALLIVAPHFVYPVFLTKMICFCLFACAYNLLAHTTGLLSFGHAAFFGGAAYVAGHAAKVWGLPFEVALLVGTASGAALGLLLGFISVRRQGLYFAMITLALAQMVYFGFFQAPFTHGDDGLSGIPRGWLFGVIDLNNDFAMYYTAAGIFLLGYLLIHRVVHSPFGRILAGIRENPARCVSLGYRIDSYKVVVFTLSAALSGLAGATKGISLHLVTLYDMHWSTSGNVLVAALLGGTETLFGPVVGAVLMTVLDDYLAETGLPVPVVIGSIFILCILLLRQGIVGELRNLVRWWSTRQDGAPKTTEH